MLPFKNRLLSKRDFEKIKKNGQKFQGGIFALLVLQTHLGLTRFGFIISKKLSPKATLRNRAKRLLREAIKKLLPIVKPGFDVLVLGKKDLLGKSLIGVQAEAQWLLKKAGVIE